MYKIEIIGIPRISEEEFLEELSQHGDIDSLEIKDDIATVTVSDQNVAEGILDDYRDRNFRGVPVTASMV